MRYLLLFDVLFILLLFLPTPNATVNALKFAAFALSAVLLRTKLPKLTPRQKCIQIVLVLVFLCACGLWLVFNSG